MRPPRLTDKHGNTVEVARINYAGIITEEFIARAPNGILLGRGMGDGVRFTTVEQVAAAGVDIASLA